MAASPSFAASWLTRRSPIDMDAPRAARRAHATNLDSDRTRPISKVASLAVAVGRSWMAAEKMRGRGCIDAIASKGLRQARRGRRGVAVVLLKDRS